MANPNVPQGVLNKALGTVAIVSLPQLNVSASFLGDDGISLRFEGAASGYPTTMTGAVPSPNPYQIAVTTIRVLKTQGLSELWKEQLEDNTAIGDVVITPDAATLSPYYLTNCIIENVEDLSFSGRTPEFVVTLKGIYQINASMFA